MDIDPGMLLSVLRCELSLASPAALPTHASDLEMAVVERYGGTGSSLSFSIGPIHQVLPVVYELTDNLTYLIDALEALADENGHHWLCFIEEPGTVYAADWEMKWTGDDLFIRIESLQQGRQHDRTNSGTFRISKKEFVAEWSEVISRLISGTEEIILEIDEEASRARNLLGRRRHK